MSLCNKKVSWCLNLVSDIFEIFKFFEIFEHERYHLKKLFYQIDRYSELSGTVFVPNRRITSLESFSQALATSQSEVN